jgi:hypothetical protein
MAKVANVDAHNIISEVTGPRLPEKWLIKIIAAGIT